MSAENSIAHKTLLQNWESNEDISRQAKVEDGYLPGALEIQRPAFEVIIQVENEIQVENKGMLAHLNENTQTETKTGIV